LEDLQFGQSSPGESAAGSSSPRNTAKRTRRSIPDLGQPAGASELATEVRLVAREIIRGEFEAVAARVRAGGREALGQGHASSW